MGLLNTVGPYLDKNTELDEVWNKALETAIEAILDIRGTFDGDTILRAREIIKELKR